MSTLPPSSSPERLAAPQIAPPSTSPGLSQPASGTPSTRWLEPILLRRAEESVRGRSAAQQQRIRAYWSAAQRRIAAARSLGDAHHAVPAISLYREAAVCLAAAMVLARDPSSAPPQAISEAWARLDELLRVEAPPDRPADFEAARAVLSEPDALACDALPEAVAAARRRVVETTMRWLAGRIEPRSAAEIRVARALRVGMAGAAALAVALAAALVVRAPRNVALHKPVVASSRAPDSPPLDAVVDGNTWASCGLRTNHDPSPSATIDLQAGYSIDSIRVYNRGDGKLKVDEELPIVVELSGDGREYAVLGRRQEPFGHVNPWTLEARGQRARYVRVRVEHPGALCLNEIEVYARDAHR